MIILLCGEYKSGKTVSACTFPKPLMLLDFDNGFKSVEKTTDKEGKLVVPDHKEITVEPFIRKGFSSLNFAVDRKGKSEPAYTKYAVPFMNKVNSILHEIDKSKKYKTLVIDSLTSMFRVWKDAVIAEDHSPMMQVQNYFTLEIVLFNQFLPMLKALEIDNVILIDHVMMDKDELSQKILEFPVGPSKPMGRMMGVEMDEIWLQKSSGDKYKWYTRKTGLFQAGSRHNLPNPVDANYKFVEEYLT